MHRAARPRDGNWSMLVTAAPVDEIRFTALRTVPYSKAYIYIEYTRRNLTMNEEVWAVYLYDPSYVAYLKRTFMYMR